jgi:adenylate cyclase
MTQRQQIKLKKLGVIIIAWLLIGFLMACYDYFVITSGLSSGLGPGFNFANHLFFSLVAAFLGALMGGSFLVFYVNEKYRDKPYGFTLLAVILSFIVVVGIITIVLAVIAAPLQTGKSFADAETKKAFYAFLTNRLHAKNIIGWSTIVYLEFGAGQIPDTKRRTTHFYVCRHQRIHCHC